MAGKTFLWIEDRKGKASYIFWNTFLKQLCPEIKVESKKNNSELVKAVRDLVDTNNRYVIVFDNSFDNLQLAMEQKRLRRYAEEKDNVMLMDIICFEYILLEFEDLIQWIYAPDDEFLTKRKSAIEARKMLLACLQGEDLEYKNIRELAIYDEHIDEHNIEQLAAKLLFDLTRNTGFEVSKGKIGECWLKSCCEWVEREKDDICGLDSRRMSIYDKMKSVYEGTCLKDQFHMAGLEVTL